MLTLHANKSYFDLYLLFHIRRICQDRQGFLLVCEGWSDCWLRRASTRRRCGGKGFSSAFCSMKLEQKQLLRVNGVIQLPVFILNPIFSLLVSCFNDFVPEYKIFQLLYSKLQSSLVWALKRSECINFCARTWLCSHRVLLS